MSKSETLNRELTVVSHSQSETADKDPKFRVTMQSTASIETDNVITITIKSTDESLFTEYPLKEKFAMKLSCPQTKLSSKSTD